MKEISQYLFIAKLICKERIAGLNDSEKKRLDSWRNESGKRERVFLDLQRISTEELEKRYDKVDVDLKWESFKKRQQQYLFVDNKWVVVMVGNFRRGACCTGRAGTTK